MEMVDVSIKVSEFKSFVKSHTSIFDLQNWDTLEYLRQDNNVTKQAGLSAYSR